MIKTLIVLHWIGLLLVGMGLYVWFFGSARGGNIGQMVWTATFFGLGGLLLSPYPIAKAFQWMTAAERNKNTYSDNP